MRPILPLLAALVALTSRASAAPCVSLSDLVPAPSELPEGWRILEPEAGGSAASGQGLTLLLASLRRAGLPLLEERRFGVATPEGPFEVAYAMLPSGADAGDALRSSVPGSGVAARQWGRVLFLASTADRTALRPLTERLSDRLASRLRDAAAAGDEAKDSGRFLECAGEFVAAFPDHGPAHFMMAEHLLFRSEAPQAAEAIPHLEKALLPNARPPLSATDRWRALYDRGVAESLLGRFSESVRTLMTAEESAPDEGQRADAQYQLAASLAMAGRGAEAMAALRRCANASRSAGRPSPLMAAAGDAAFVSLRDDAAFRELVGAPPVGP